MDRLTVKYRIEAAGVLVTRGTLVSNDEGDTIAGAIEAVEQAAGRFANSRQEMVSYFGAVFSNGFEVATCNGTANFVQPIYL